VRASHSKLILWFTLDKAVVVPHIVAFLAQLEHPQLVVSTIIIIGTLSLAELALAVIIIKLARAAFALARFFALPLSSSSSLPHS
jgi:hypothetical protein